MSKKVEDGLAFELDGKVWIIDTKDGVETREELDGKLVLQCLMSVLTQAVNIADAQGVADESKTTGK